MGWRSSRVLSADLRPIDEDAASEGAVGRPTARRIRRTLVMEVVSGGPQDRKRDLVIKRAEYAAAGIPEYWIVDPESRRITVLTLVGAI